MRLPCSLAQALDSDMPLNALRIRMRPLRSRLVPVLAVALACYRSAPTVSALSPSRATLEVTVRPADRPTQPLPDARVVLRGLRDTLARAADDHGIASFPDVP